MTTFSTPNPDWRARLDREFAAQPYMRTIQAGLGVVEPGYAEIVVDNHDGIVQQYGYVHGGVVGSLLDTACGFCTMTLLEADHIVLTVEYKVNFLRPAEGSHFQAIGRIKKAGRTIVVCEAELIADDRHDRPIATMSATMMATPDRGVAPT